MVYLFGYRYTIQAIYSLHYACMFPLRIKYLISITEGGGIVLWKVSFPRKNYDWCNVQCMVQCYQRKKLLNVFPKGKEVPINIPNTMLRKASGIAEQIGNPLSINQLSTAPNLQQPNLVRTLHDSPAIQQDPLSFWTGHRSSERQTGASSSDGYCRGQKLLWYLQVAGQAWSLLCGRSVSAHGIMTLSLVVRNLVYSVPVQWGSWSRRGMSYPWDYIRNMYRIRWWTGPRTVTYTCWFIVVCSTTSCNWSIPLPMAMVEPDVCGIHYCSPKGTLLLPGCRRSPWSTPLQPG